MSRNDIHFPLDRLRPRSSLFHLLETWSLSSRLFIVRCRSLSDGIPSLFTLDTQVEMVNISFWRHFYAKHPPIRQRRWTKSSNRSTMSSFRVHLLRSSSALPITEQLYVGLYCSDCVCQTNEEEIVPLKKTTDLLNTLYQVERVQRIDVELSLLFDRKSTRWKVNWPSPGIVSVPHSTKNFKPMDKKCKTSRLPPCISLFEFRYYQLTDKLDVLRKKQSKVTTETLDELFKRIFDA